MKRNGERVCDTLTARGCQREVATVMFCTVEGRDIELCRHCHAEWRRYVGAVPALQPRCPRCAPSYVKTHSAEIEAARLRISGEDAIPLSGPLAEAISKAMFSEGVLVDVRRRVLVRLRMMAQTEQDSYAASLLRTTADPPLGPPGMPVNVA